MATPAQRGMLTVSRSFTVSDSGATFFSIVHQKKQNEKERWNMIDGSFMTTLPDTWAISKRFIMLPVNNWNDEYERVFLGGMTCDSDDYYNSEQHINAIYLPKFQEDRKQYIGYFNTGAYQDTLGGFGGIQHCLIPKPKHVLIDRLPDAPNMIVIAACSGHGFKHSAAIGEAHSTRAGRPNVVPPSRSDQLRAGWRCPRRPRSWSWRKRRTHARSPAGRRRAPRCRAP